MVNTATGCGLTPQYQGLQDLYLRYQEKGLEILDIPVTNSWGKPQELQKKSIASVASTTRPPFHDSLKPRSMVKKPFLFMTGSKSQATGPLGKRIEWNFAKFVIDRQGQVAQRFSSKTEPAAMEDLIQELLDK